MQLSNFTTNEKLIKSVLELKKLVITNLITN